MPLHALSDDERRSHCRREIEALEHWLRRLVHETFSRIYGPAYLDANGEEGNRLFASKVADEIKARHGREPLRFPRLIDAADLDDLVNVICKSETYMRHFRDVLQVAFPQGNEVARTFLKRIIEVRHKLSHANPITVHEAMRVICYTQDVLAALKEHYVAMNQEMEYNVPLVTKVIDSQGNVRHASEIRRNSSGSGVCLFHKELSGRLYPGDRLVIEVEVDPTFERPSYMIRWGWPSRKLVDPGDSERVVIDIHKSHVQPKFPITCAVKSNKDWHKHGSYDDIVTIYYKILPPIS